MLDRSWKTGSVRPYSQEELPHVGQHSLGIDSSTRSLVLSGPVKKAFYNSYSLASLLGVIVTMIHTLGIASSTIDFSSFEIFMMVLMPLVVATFLIWYAKLAESKGWIS